MTAAAVAAAIDIGTNSVKVTVGRREADGKVTVLHDATQITRLGKNVDASGQLDENAVQRTLDALETFAREAKAHGTTRIAAVGTSALRDASNGAAFVKKARKILGGTVEVIAGEREAQLTYTAARRDPNLALPTDPDTILATIDIGGGSTEIVLGRNDAVLYRDSLQLGAVRVTERALPSDPPSNDELKRAEALADERLGALPAEHNAPVVLVGSGGTIANLVAMELMDGANPPDAITPDILHGVRLTREQIEARIARLAALPLAERRSVPGLEPDRADVIIAGAIVLSRAMRRLDTKTVLASARGLRYGLLYELLDR